MIIDFVEGVVVGDIKNVEGGLGDFSLGGYKM